MTRVRNTWPRWAAWALIVAAIVFWFWFGVGSAYVEGLGPVNWLLHILVPGGMFALAALVAWRWPRAGGALLVAEGILALGFIVRAFLWGRFTASTFVLMALTLALPPLAAGVLFLVSRPRVG